MCVCFRCMNEDKCICVCLIPALIPFDFCLCSLGIFPGCVVVLVASSSPVEGRGRDICITQCCLRMKRRLSEEDLGSIYLSVLCTADDTWSNSVRVITSITDIEWKIFGLKLLLRRWMSKCVVSLGEAGGLKTWPSLKFSKHHLFLSLPCRMMIPMLYFMVYNKSQVNPIFN